MDSADRARRESEEARQRLSAIALELAERTAPDRMKALANEKREEWTAKAKEKAGELQEKAKHKAQEKLDELKIKAKDQAQEKMHELKETAVNKSYEMRDRALVNPKLIGAIGALLGAKLGAWLARSGHLRPEQRSFNYQPDYRTGYPNNYPLPSTGYAGDQWADQGNTGGIADRVGDSVSGTVSSVKDAASNLTDKASDVIHNAKESVSHAVGNVREKIPSAGEMKDSASHMMNRAVTDYPWVLALGAIGFGVLASMLVPETDAERRGLANMKRKAQSQLQKLGQNLEQQIGGGGGEEEQSDDESSGLISPPNAGYTSAGSITTPDTLH